MEKFKVFIRRFAEDDIRLTVGITAANNTKSEATKIISSLDEIEQHTTGVLDGLKQLPSGGRQALHGLQTAVKDLVKQAEELKTKMAQIAPGASAGFNTNVNKLESKSALKETKMGFTGGTSKDTTVLLKEAEYLYNKIFASIKLIRQEEQGQIKDANQLINALTKEAQLKEQQSQQKQVQVAFETSYTDLGGADLTAKYREEYDAIMKKLTAEQKELVVKKLMSEENKKLVNSTVAEIQALKEGKLASTGNASTMDKLRTVVNGLSAASEKAGNKFKEFIGKVKKGAITFRIIGGLVRQMFGAFMSLYDKAASYEEAINLYRTSFGEYAEEADKWAERISTALYLDPKDIMQYAGSFYNLTKGLGVSSAAAYKMATNLTQLSYDMSSFLNIDVSEAQAKIQSAITGQARAVASAGVAMQQASLQELAYTMGITKEVSEMNQREKTYLRYIQIMKSTANMQQDLGKTIITPENALRVIRNQFEMLGRAIGQVFIPIVMKVIPYIMVLTQALQKLASKLASLLGFKIADVDYSSITTADTYLEGLGDSADSAAGKVKGAAASINRSLAPFDNLNVVESESAGSGGTGGVGGGDDVSGILEDYLTGYDMLEKLTDSFNNQLDDAREKLKSMLPWVIGIGTALLAWKLTTGFMNAIVFVDDFIKAWSNMKELQVFTKMKESFTSIGPALVKLFNASLISDLPAAFASIAGAVADVAAGSMTFADAWSIFILPAVETIAAVIGGILLTIQGIFKISQGIKTLINGDAIKGIAQTIEGIALVVAGIALLFGGWVVAAIAAVVAIVAYVVENWEVIKAFFEELWASMLEIVTNIAQSIIDFFAPIADWINNNLIKPVMDLISPIFPYIEAAFKAMGDTIKMVLEAAKSIFKTVFGTIFTVASKVLGDIIDIISGIVAVVTTVLSKIWEIVSKIFEVIFTLIKVGVQTLWDFTKTAINAVLDIIRPIATWVYNTLIQPIITRFLTFVTTMNTKVIQPLVGFFETAVNKIFGFFQDVAVDIAEAFSSTFKSVLNGAFKIVEDLLNGFIDGFNKVIGVINEIPGVDINKIKRIELPRFENGGYPNSGDLFWANENGRAEYITSIGNRTAVANQDQMIAAISTAITQSMSNTNKGNDGIIQVYIGNDKVYEGHGTYQNRQSDRYGVTYVQV